MERGRPVDYFPFRTLGPVMPLLCASLVYGIDLSLDRHSTHPQTLQNAIVYGGTPGIVSERGGALRNAAFGVVLVSASEERSKVNPEDLIITPEVEQKFQALWEGLPPTLQQQVLAHTQKKTLAPRLLMLFGIG